MNNWGYTRATFLFLVLIFSGTTLFLSRKVNCVQQNVPTNLEYQKASCSSCIVTSGKSNGVNGENKNGKKHKLKSKGKRNEKK